MTKDELIEKTDKAISELVYPKYDLQKAYNYYNGIRDKELFKYLEDVYGINTPTTLHFTPLIKKHIDVLVGEYLGFPIIPKVFCKDSDTISFMERDKKIKIATEVAKYLQTKVKNSLLSVINGKDITDKAVSAEIKKIKEEVENSFISDYEIAALNIIEYIMQSRDTDITTVLRELALDLFISGYTYFKVCPTTRNNGIRIKPLSPLNTFIESNPESPYIKTSNRAVVRHWMTKTEILSRYGKLMSSDDRKLLLEKWDSIYDNALYYVRLNNSLGCPATSGLLAGIEVTPGYPDVARGIQYELIPVYEVEWLETDKDFIMQRYETIRIGEEIYILNGKNENVVRSMSDPSYCSLSVNGVHFLNRGTRPYSLMLACAHLLDLYDLLHFYRDHLIASSGTVGDWIDLTLIPTELGVTLPERILNWQAYKKQGLGILDSSLEGRMASGTAPLNTIFNGYDDTLKLSAIAAIQVAIESIEATASSITGVFRERLNGIEAHDAVSNVKIGLTNSFNVTKLYYHTLDLLINEILLDSLNMAKIVFKNGLTGTIILGDRFLRTFTALSEHFTLTDFDVRILTSSDVVLDLETVKSIVPKFVEAGGLPPDIIIEAITSKSLPDLKNKVKRAMRRQEEEASQIKQLSEQLKLMELAMTLAEKQIKEYESKIKTLEDNNDQLKKEEMKMKYEIEWYKAKTDRDYKETIAKTQEDRTKIEVLQMYDRNPYNDQIRID